MAETAFFRSQVVDIMLARLCPQGQLLNNLYTINLKAFYFLWIISQYAYLLKAQITTDLSTDSIVSFVSHKPKFEVCFNGIESLLLQFVGA